MPKIGDNISLEQREGISIISIRDSISYQTADELRAAYDQIRDEKILVDLGQVRLTTSRGMATLIAITLDAREKNQQVGFCNVSAYFMNILETMEIPKYVPELKLFEALDEGLSHFRNV